MNDPTSLPPLSLIEPLALTSQDAVPDPGDGAAPRPIVTICRDCVFAQRTGTTQEGCLFDRIEAFAANGAEIRGVDDGVNRYYAIVGRFCNAVRNEAWAGKFEGKSREDLMSEAYAEFAARVTMLIYVEPAAADAAIDASIASAVDQTLRPLRLVLLFSDADPRVGRYVARFRSAPPGVPWDVHRVIAPDLAQREEYGTDDYGLAVDGGLARCTTTYYTAARAGHAWPADFLQRLDQAINWEMERVVGVHPADAAGNGFLVQANFHQLVGGNRRESVLAKLLATAGDQGLEGLIRTYEGLEGPALTGEGLGVARDAGAGAW